MTQQVTRVRVFVASPGDVQKERDSLDDVLKELNDTYGQKAGFIADLVRWETHCRPAMGRIYRERILELNLLVDIAENQFAVNRSQLDGALSRGF